MLALLANTGRANVLGVQQEIGFRIWPRAALTSLSRPG